MNTDIVLRDFIFNDSSVRVTGTPDNPWFVAKDICCILGLSNITEATRIIPDKWKSSEILKTCNRKANMLIISEPGLYQLIIKSTKPEALAFRDWVFEKVIPTIRMTGEYRIKSELEEKNKEIQHLNRLLKRKLKKTHKKGNSVYVVKNPDIDNKFKIGSTKDIDQRLKNYESSTPHEYELLFHQYIEPMKAIEEILLFILDKYRCESEIKGSKKREWLEIDSDTIITEINELCEYIISRRKDHDENYDENQEIPEENDENQEIENENMLKCIDCKENKELCEYYDRFENTSGKEYICKKCYVQRQLKARASKIEERTKENKRKCRKCKFVHDISMYQEHPTSKDGLSYVCTNCTSKMVVHRTEKPCSMCKVVKSLDNYNNCSTSSDGKFAYCRDCTKIKNAQYKAKIRKK